MSHVAPRLAEIEARHEALRRRVEGVVSPVGFGADDRESGRCRERKILCLGDADVVHTGRSIATSNVTIERLHQDLALLRGGNVRTMASDGFGVRFVCVL